MPNILLTYWWNGHEPGEIVETDDQTAREILGVIGRPAEDAPDPESVSDPAPESSPASESGR